MLWRILGQEQDVLDAYQDCWCSLAAIATPGKLNNAKAFAYRTAMNIAIEMIRRKARRRNHWPGIVSAYKQKASGEDSPVENRCHSENRYHNEARCHAADNRDSSAGSRSPSSDDGALNDSRLRQSIEQLPQHLRQVIVLRDLATMNYKEVGKILSIEPATARVYRRQAVVKLAELMSERFVS